MVTFYIKDRKKEKSTIRCSIKPKGLDRFHFTVPNSAILVKEWDKGRMKTGKGKQENSYIQNDLNRIKETIENFYSEYYRIHHKYPKEAVFKSFINAHKSVSEYFTLYKKVKLLEYIRAIADKRMKGTELVNGRKYSLQTINCYNSLILALEDFKKYKNKSHLYLDEFTDIKKIEDFEYYLTSEKNMAKNTIHNRLKTLKAFLQVAVNEDLIPYNPFKKYKKVLTTEESDVIVFSEEELAALEGLDFSENPYHDQIRDQYLIYVWSGIRKGDLKNFLSVVNPTTRSYVFRSSKTGETCEIPAFDTLKRLGEKYNYQFPKPIHDIIVLHEIKEICKQIPSMCVPIERKYTKGGKEVREIKKKYELVVIHTARRTLATILVDRGLPYHLVMKITGHKKISTLQKYIKSKADLDLMLKIGNGRR